MNLSYSSYKNDIISFNSEEYIKNLINSISYNYFFNFIENYKEIENEDFKKPIFSQTSKFKKIPNNKNYKYSKINRDNNDEIKNVWAFENPTEECDKISILIKTYLNKISQEAYVKISNEFINELILVKNKNIFDILSSEILNKCLFDNKYRNLYINLCYKIWTNKQIHQNLINIINIDNNYYWEYNSEKKGPFTSEINAKNDCYNKINFKKYFLNYIQSLYINKDLSFNNLNDEEMYIKKKKIILLVELIAIIYLEKYINFDIINIIIIDLLHLNGNNFKNIEEIEIEILYTLIKLIKDNKASFNDLQEYKNIFGDYNKIILQIIDNIKISKRSVFFLNDIILMFNEFINNKSIKKNNNENIEIKKSNIIDLLKINNTKDLLNLYKNDNYDFMYKLIEIFISQKNFNKNIENLLYEINNTKLFFTIIEKIIENINDIMLDIPDANNKFLYLIDNIKENHPRKEYIINILKNINLDDESEDDESEDDKSEDDESEDDKSEDDKSEDDKSEDDKSEDDNSED
jgi:hypothetical protein